MASLNITLPAKVVLEPTGQAKIEFWCPNLALHIDMPRQEMPFSESIAGLIREGSFTASGTVAPQPVFTALTNAHRLALAVLAGDATAALGLVDAVLESSAEMLAVAARIEPFK